MLSTEDLSLTTEQCHAVNYARGQATAYVWGWQDAGGSRDSGYSLDFGDAFARVKAEYVAGRRGSMPSIQAAFNEWRAARQITDGIL